MPQVYAPAFSPHEGGGAFFSPSDVGGSQSTKLDVTWDIVTGTTTAEDGVC